MRGTFVVGSFALTLGYVCTASIAFADAPAAALASNPAPAAAPSAPSGATSAPSAAAPSTAAPADDEARRNEASERYRRAVQIFKEGDMKLALIEFRRAYALIPNFQVLYNIGVTADRLGRYAESVQAYEQYLKDGGGEVPQARVEEVQASLKILRQRTAYLSLLVDEAKAEIFLDGEKIGESPMPETLVGAGTHDLRIVKAGFEPTSQSIALAGGDHSAVKVHLVQKKDPILIGADSGGLGPVWIGWGFTAAGTVATVGLAIVWQGAQKDLDDKLASATTRAQLDSAQSKADTFRTLTFVVGGATLVAAGVSLYFTLTRGSGNKADAHDKKAANVWFDGSGVSGRF